ncbi:MAG: carboxypeptidase regulatory-like domain-containing protein, partial [Chthonomonadaceae bacterium]|nr:carboxypeptidase regulatory-like domain-containing protein [Chthonomonadaceae bacterium]
MTHMKSIGGVLGTLGSILLMASVWSVGLTAEIPLGGVHGVVTMEPSKKPLPNAEVILSPRFEVPEDSKNTWIVRTDSLGRYDVRSLPAGNYSVNVYGKSYSTQDERLSLVIQEGKSATYDVKTTRLYADLQMSASQRVYLPEEKPKLTLSGFTDEESARFQVYKVPYESVFEKRDPATVVRSIVANRNVVEPNSMSGLEITFDENRNLTRKDAEGEFVEQVDLPSLPIGLYVVRGKVGKETKYQWLSVTSLALVTKAQGNHVLAYVTDLKTGVPVLGARISYANKASLIPAGATDANGLLEFVRGADMSTGLDDNETKLVIADHSGSRAFTWFYSGSDSNAGKTAFWVQTDRPVYRPGDTVHYKVVARTDLGRTYEVPNGQVSVQVMDSDENVVGQQSLTLTPFGSVSGDFRIDGQAMPEPYRLKLSHGASSDFHDVPVMAYRKPEYIVTVRSKSKSVIRGDSVEFKVHVESYTGEPAAGQKLTATPYVRPDWSYTPFEDDYVENDGYDYLGDMLPALESVTNDQGDATLLVPTTGPESEALDATDSTMTLEVVAEDPGGRGTDGKGAVRVVRGEFSLAVMPDRYMAEPGQQVTLTINGKWNEDGQALVGQSLDIETGHFRWTGNSSVFVREGLDKVSLDSSGQVGYSWNPQTTGESIARISAKDKRGNTVLSEVVVWGSAPGSSPAGPVPDLSLTLDKPSYLPTDSARALVRTNRPGGAALMTVEAEGVLWKSVVKLSESTTIVPIPQVDAYAPAATVSLSYVVDKSYLSAQRTIKVDLVQKRLKVELTPSSKVLQPGGSVVFQVKTTDEATGATVPSEVAVGVVDESIYAISEDVNDPVKSFYPRRWSTVQTAYSFPEIYLDGDEKNPVAPK